MDEIYKLNNFLKEICIERQVKRNTQRVNFLNN